MNTRKSMKLPVVITLIMIVIIIYLFATIKQTEVICEKSKMMDADIRLSEKIVSTLDGKSIKNLVVTKKIILPEKYGQEKYLKSIEFSLKKTLDYLGKKVKYIIDEEMIIIKIEVSKDEIVLLDNIEFFDNGDLEIKINSNTKSSDIITLQVGDNTTLAEYMKKLKNNGYSCK